VEDLLPRRRRATLPTRQPAKCFVSCPLPIFYNWQLTLTPSSPPETSDHPPHPARRASGPSAPSAPPPALAPTSPPTRTTPPVPAPAPRCPGAFPTPRWVRSPSARP